MIHPELLKKFPKPLLLRLLAPVRLRGALAGVNEVGVDRLALRASRSTPTSLRKHESFAARRLGKSSMNRSNTSLENSIPLGNALALPLSACGASQEFWYGGWKTALGAVFQPPYQRIMSERVAARGFPTVSKFGMAHICSTRHIRATSTVPSSRIISAVRSVRCLSSIRS